jgi:hypothetical protein
VAGQVVIAGGRTFRRAHRTAPIDYRLDRGRVGDWLTPARWYVKFIHMEPVQSDTSITSRSGRL